MKQSAVVCILGSEKWRQRTTKSQLLSLCLLFNILDLGGLALRYNVRVSERVRPLFCL